MLDLARHSRTCDGAPVGVYPETKHPTYFDSIGLSLEEPLLAALDANGSTTARSPVIIQSFETGNLRELDRSPTSRSPSSSTAAGRRTTWWPPATRAPTPTWSPPPGCAEIATYADGVGACKDRVIPRDARRTPAAADPVIARRPRAGLVVHRWTFRRENQFLPAEFRRGTAPNAPGDLAGEIRAFLEAGIDGFFTDNPDIVTSEVPS